MLSSSSVNLNGGRQSFGPSLTRGKGAKSMVLRGPVTSDSWRL